MPNYSLFYSDVLFFLFLCQSPLFSPILIQSFPYCLIFEVILNKALCITFYGMMSSRAANGKTLPFY